MKTLYDVCVVSTVVTKMAVFADSYDAAKDLAKKLYEKDERYIGVIVDTTHIYLPRKHDPDDKEVVINNEPEVLYEEE